MYSCESKSNCSTRILCLLSCYAPLDMLRKNTLYRKLAATVLTFHVFYLFVYLLDMCKETTLLGRRVITLFVFKLFYLGMHRLGMSSDITVTRIRVTTVLSFYIFLYISFIDKFVIESICDMQMLLKYIATFKTMPIYRWLC